MKTIHALFVTLALIGTQASFVDAKISDAELFKYKQVCADMRPSVESSLEKYNRQVPDAKGAITVVTLQKIFYSPKQNSCVYFVEDAKILGQDVVGKSLRLHDALTGERLEINNIDYKKVDGDAEEAAFINLMNSYEANP